MNEKIGWIGLGAMGRPMATNVAKAGFDLTVCNRNIDVAEPLIEFGAHRVASPGAIADRCDILFVCVPNREASEAVADEVFNAAARPEIYVELSTLAPNVARDLAARAERAGISFIDAPVSGTVKERNEGAVTLMAGGLEEPYRRVRPVIDAFAKNVFLLGPAGSGSTAKACNQLIVMSSFVSIIEAYILGSRHGLDLAALRDAIMAASGAGRTVQLIGNEFCNRTYRALGQPRAALHLAVKDLEQVLEMASEINFPVPAAARALDIWREADRSGLGEADIYTLIEFVEGRGSRTRVTEA